MCGHVDWYDQLTVDDWARAQEQRHLAAMQEEMRLVRQSHEIRQLEGVVRERTLLQSRPLTRRPALPI